LERRFGYVLTAIGGVALAVRVVYALAVAKTIPPRADTLVFSLLGSRLAEGKGFIKPFSDFMGHPVPTALHPPLYPVYLAFWSLFGLDDLDSHRVVSCLLGAVAVVLIGLLARRLAGNLVGLLAAAIATVYPQLFMVDGTVISEALYAPLVALILILAYRLIATPTRWSAAALGLAIGAATLTRPEGLGFVVFVAVPACIAAMPKGPWWPRIRQALPLALIVVAVPAVVVAPWVIRNAVVMHKVELSSNGGPTLQETNCPETYYGRGIGFAAGVCFTRSPCARIEDETKRADCGSHEAKEYIRSHLSRLPIVIAARVARVFQVYRVPDDLNYGQYWERRRDFSKVGFAMYVLMVLLLPFGFVALRRRRIPVWPLVMPFVLVTLSVAATFGYSRYRLPAEIPLVVFAAVGIDAIARWVRARRAAPAAAPPS
jgi:4-amino-4-deoxy-L-arabinose transferase-like glycosyltransferase